MCNRVRTKTTRAAATVQTASSTIAAMKNAAAALVKNASTAAMPATTPHSGRRLACAYAAHATTMNIVIVDSMSAARFQATHVKLAASTAPPMSAVRSACRLVAACSPAMSAMIARRPEATGTVRACQVPTPNTLNAPYSSAVNTGAMNTGFQLSVRQVPQSAALRALCTHAPSSCHTIPTDVFGGSARNQAVRSAVAASRMVAARMSHRWRDIISPSAARPRTRCLRSPARSGHRGTLAAPGCS